jgi:hypothetical protein
MNLHIVVYLVPEGQFQPDPIQEWKMPKNQKAKEQRNDARLSVIIYKELKTKT